MCCFGVCSVFICCVLFASLCFVHFWSVLYVRVSVCGDTSLSLGKSYGVCLDTMGSQSAQISYYFLSQSKKIELVSS